MDNDNEYLINTPSIKIKYILAGIVIVVAIALWVVVKLIIGSYGNEQIGSFFEKSEYTTQYWVYLQPENTAVKSYRVKGDIRRIEGSGGSGEGDYGYPATYRLERIYWDNGGYTYFDDCDITTATTNGKGAHCRVDDNISYTIRLGEKVK